MTHAERLRGQKEERAPTKGRRVGGRSGPTFHCSPRVLLVRWVSFGDDGTSGTLQCVVKEPASELEPRTELYVADTLKEKREDSEEVSRGRRTQIRGSVLTGRDSLSLALSLSGETPAALR